ncbi:MAG: hypothetical protein DMF64_13945 [Acidobacteria bacterium]|nr:MAG: hypothetical protein DMF64_13945 [Acidobacteriota bacterium]
MKPDVRPRPTGPLMRPDRVSGALTPPVAPPREVTRTPERADTTVTLLGRKLSPAELNTALAHFYRGEIQRSNTWRNRLDTTTNWAVITAGATLSFAFSSAANPHFVIPINSILVAFFLFMEARRYRYYEIWASRVRVLETGYFAPLLTGAPTDTDWAQHLAEDLRTPRFTISEWEAVGRRLRRNYLWIFALLAASWNLKVYLHPKPAVNFDEFLSRAAIGFVPGELMVALGIVFNVAVLLFAFGTLRLRQATGEVLPQHQFNFHPIRSMSNLTRAARQRRATVRRTKKARERTRMTRTGEFKRPDLDDIHRTQFPVKEETITK